MTHGPEFREAKESEITKRFKSYIEEHLEDVEPDNEGSKEKVFLLTFPRQLIPLSSAEFRIIGGRLDDEQDPKFAYVIDIVSAADGPYRFTCEDDGSRWINDVREPEDVERVTEDLLDRLEAAVANGWMVPKIAEEAK